jgi:hypothetical protein
MIVKPKTACGDEDDLFSNLGPCSDFYVSKRVPTTIDRIWIIPGMVSLQACTQRACALQHPGPWPVVGTSQLRMFSKLMEIE